MLTAIAHDYGWVELSSTLVGSTYTWYKDGLQFATSGSGQLNDYRPDKNFKYVSMQKNTYSVGDVTRFTFTGVAVGLVVDLPWTGYSHWVTVDAYVDGVYDMTFQPVSNSADGSNMYDIIFWSKGNLPYGQHTVEFRVTDVSGAPFAPKGFWYTDRDKSLGQPVTYEVEVNGTRESVTIVPAVQRRKLIEREINTYLASWRATNYTSGNGGDPLTMHALTGNEEFATIAHNYYADQKAKYADAYGSMINGNEVNITHTGRFPEALYHCYKEFKDPFFLEWADQMITTYLTKWPKMNNYTSPSGKPAYNNILGYHVSLDYSTVLWNSFLAPGEFCGNSIAHAAVGMAMAYCEPDSIHYKNPDVLNLYIENMRFSLELLQPDGGILYSSRPHSSAPDYNYGTYQTYNLLYAYQYLSQLGEYHFKDELDRMVRWHLRHGLVEPISAEMIMYGGSMTVGCAICVAASYKKYLGEPIPQMWFDLGYLAYSTVSGLGSNISGYNPGGAHTPDDGAGSAGSGLTASLYSAVGIPISEWGYTDSVATTTMAFGAPFGSPFGQDVPSGDITAQPLQMSLSISPVTVDSAILTAESISISPLQLSPSIGPVTVLTNDMSTEDITIGTMQLTTLLGSIRLSSYVLGDTSLDRGIQFSWEPIETQYKWRRCGDVEFYTGEEKPVSGIISADDPNEPFTVVSAKCDYYDENKAIISSGPASIVQIAGKNDKKITKTIKASNIGIQTVVMTCVIQPDDTSQPAQTRKFKEDITVSSPI